MVQKRAINRNCIRYGKLFIGKLSRLNKMIELEEINIKEIEEFWKLHIAYLVDDGIIRDPEDIEYFKSDEYRNVIKAHMVRDKDKHHLIYFMEDGKRIGAASYCIYKSEDCKCFILDYWIFEEYRNNNLGHLCFEKLEEVTKRDGATYYEINSLKEDSIRFWKSLGFVENGIDEYGEKLFIKK